MPKEQFKVIGGIDPDDIEGSIDSYLEALKTLRGDGMEQVSLMEKKGEFKEKLLEVSQGALEQLIDLALAHYTDEEWAKLTQTEREKVAKTVLGSFTEEEVVDYLDNNLPK